MRNAADTQGYTGFSLEIGRLDMNGGDEVSVSGARNVNLVIDLGAGDDRFAAAVAGSRVMSTVGFLRSTGLRC